MCAHNPSKKKIYIYVYIAKSKQRKTSQTNKMVSKPTRVSKAFKSVGHSQCRVVVCVLKQQKMSSSHHGYLLRYWLGEGEFLSTCVLLF